jgi:low affinity Fe/Cu permease
VQSKLDRLLRAQQGAQSAFINLEGLEEEDLDRTRARHIALAEKVRATFLAEPDTGIPK